VLQPLCEVNTHIYASSIILDISKYLFYHVKRGMITFYVSKEIHASLDKIWNLRSDIDREPEFWHGTKSVKNMEKDGNIVG
jgi:hypothetical protein